MFGALLTLLFYAEQPVIPITLALPSLPQEKQTQSAPKSAKIATDFETDKRLNTPLSIALLKCSHADIWTRLDRRTGVAIEREESARELDDSSVAIAGNQTSARALMDAIAARILARWEKTERNGYRFLTSQNERDFTYSAKDEWEEERFKAGAEFLREMKKLPPDEQAAILSGKPYPVSELPNTMQQPLRTMLEALYQSNEAKGFGNGEPPRLPSEATLTIERKSAKGFDRFAFSFGNGASPGGSFRINNYDEKKKERLAVKGKEDTYTPVRYEIKPESAKKLPALKRLVSINLQDVTYPEVLKQLNAKYGVAFVSDPKVSMPHKADVVLTSMPLGDLLDELTKLYPGTEWEWRKYGFLVVRGPENQIRRGVLIGGLEKKRKQQAGQAKENESVTNPDRLP